MINFGHKIKIFKLEKIKTNVGCQEVLIKMEKGVMIEIIFPNKKS